MKGTERGFRYAQREVLKIAAKKSSTVNNEQKTEAKWNLRRQILGIGIFVVVWGTLLRVLTELWNRGLLPTPF